MFKKIYSNVVELKGTLVDLDKIESISEAKRNANETEVSANFAGTGVHFFNETDPTKFEEFEQAWAGFRVVFAEYKNQKICV